MHKYNICILYMTDTITDVPVISSPPGVSTPSPISASASSPGASGTGGVNWGTVLKVFLILVILAILGLNVFTYLAKGSNYFGQTLGNFAQYLPSALRDTLLLSEKGTALGVDVAGGTVQSAGDVLARELGLRRDQMWRDRDATLRDAVNNRQIPQVNRYPEYEPDTTESNVQVKRKPGWCYIGTDRGFRSCIRVEDSDKCMSGRIFPTRDICINPSLRQ